MKQMSLIEMDGFLKGKCIIYGQDNWLSNPWVWVIEFKRIQE